MTTTAHIDTAAVAHNVAMIRDHVGDSLVCAVVKADGYGHGAIGVARVAIEAGASWLAVATAPEAVELASLADPAGVAVLVLSERPDSELRAAWAGLPSRIRFVVATESGARTLDSLAAPGPTVPVHIKVDTGMHRVGVDPVDASTLADLVESLPSLQLEGLCSHLAVADEPSNDFTAIQIRRFDRVLADMVSAGHDPAIVHLANSAGALTLPATHHDMVRLGIAMYGVAPSAMIDSSGLRPAMRITSEVSAVRLVEAGESVSYGRRWYADRPTVVATVPVGYADGIRRDSGMAGVEMLVGGVRRPIIGAVTMDQTMLMVDDSVVVGDEVTVIGSQGSDEISVAEIAERLGTIPYEVLVSVGARIGRRMVG